MKKEASGTTSPAHHNLEAYLGAYIIASRLAWDPEGPFFRSTVGQSRDLTDRPLHQPDVYRMITRRATAAGIRTRIGCHTFRAKGITEYLRNGGKLEIAQAMANHESARGRRVSMTGVRIKYLSMKLGGSILQTTIAGYLELC